MTLAKWDAEIAPLLISITHGARRARVSMQFTASGVRALKSRPQWLTKAQAELEEAEKQTTETLLLIQRAIREYAELKVED